jgi:predicted AAA+ superfamily ATPase
MCNDRAGESGRVKELADEFGAISVQHPVFLAGCIDLVAQAMRTAGLHEQLTGLIKASRVSGLRATTQVNFARAAAAEAREDWKESFEILLSVIESCDRMAHRFLGTMARLNAVRVARLLGRDDDQAKLLDEAESLATKMGAQRFLEEIAAMRGEGRKAATSGSRA